MIRWGYVPWGHFTVILIHYDGDENKPLTSTIRLLLFHFKNPTPPPFHLNLLVPHVGRILSVHSEMNYCMKCQRQIISTFSAIYWSTFSDVRPKCCINVVYGEIKVVLYITALSTAKYILILNSILETVLLIW